LARDMMDHGSFFLCFLDESRMRSGAVACPGSQPSLLSIRGPKAREEVRGLGSVQSGSRPPEEVVELKWDEAEAEQNRQSAHPN
jgi:hypothetical protein